MVFVPRIPSTESGQIPGSGSFLAWPASAYLNCHLQLLTFAASFAASFFALVPPRVQQTSSNKGHAKVITLPLSLSLLSLSLAHAPARSRSRARALAPALTLALARALASCMHNAFRSAHAACLCCVLLRPRSRLGRRGCRQLRRLGSLLALLFPVLG